ncbi:hypothetical protein IFM89_031226 [Coptis chinensis]|uniref:Uncharacterized protein n=1 Tax=Coptis chinensis TaxID=261450 RepID=A0A835IVN4_9MAGN|nr:hypothetical protein IFM89_031226 [Coptis chinensis]
MTMVPPQYLAKSKQHHQQQEQRNDSYNGCEGSHSSCLGFDHHLQAAAMADQEESRTSTSCVNEVESDSKEQWLQLGLGGFVDPVIHQTGSRRDDLVELDLFLPSPPPPPQQQQQQQQPQHVMSPSLASTNHVASTSSHNMTSPLLLQNPRTSLVSFSHQEVPWGCRPYLYDPITSSPSSSSWALQPPSMGISFSSPYHCPSLDISIPISSSWTVSDPPRRTSSGLWFMIQASQHQAKEPFLPQVSKRYLRIKYNSCFYLLDGKMTVQMLMKYLVNKLKLNSESEVEITCKGQQLPHFLTLQHVRDSIWSSRGTLFSLKDSSSTTDHIMILSYGRSSER